MPSEQSTSELTTRDVLLQVDRRLTLIEEDVRSLDERTDVRFDSIEEKMDTRFRASEEKMDARFRVSEEKMDARFHASEEKMDARFRASEEKTDARFSVMDTRFSAIDTRFSAIDTRFSSLDTKIDTGINGLRREMNTRFYWLIGLFFAGWLFMIGTILFKS